MNTLLRIVAIDDEPLALRRLRMICRDLPDAELVGEASGCISGLEEVSRLRPDLILLDIQMRDGSGFDLLQRLSGDHVPAIIFVSAFDHYAIRAFEAQVVDYVLKPVQFDRLKDAIDRARARIAANGSAIQIDELKSVVEALRSKMREASAQRFETELWIRRNVTGFARVPVENIEWVTSEDDYVRIHTDTGSHLLRASIRSLCERIDASMFVRIHRKTLVNKSAIRELRRPRVGRLEVVLRSGERLATGRVYAKQLRKAVLAQHDAG